MRAALGQKRAIAVTLALPAKLNEQVAAIATVTGTSFHTAAAVLLEDGLKVQEQRELEIHRLTEAVVAAKSEQEQNEATDQLGEMIFGK